VVPHLGEARSRPEGVANSDDSVEVVRRAWEAWERGDMQAVFDFYDPAVEWGMSESRVPDMGDRSGGSSPASLTSSATSVTPSDRRLASSSAAASASMTPAPGRAFTRGTPGG
jgi:hypothetical protein